MLWHTCGWDCTATKDFRQASEFRAPTTRASTEGGQHPLSKMRNRFFDAAHDMRLFGSSHSLANLAKGLQQRDTERHVAQPATAGAYGCTEAHRSCISKPPVSAGALRNERRLRLCLRRQLRGPTSGAGKLLQLPSKWFCKKALPC